MKNVFLLLLISLAVVKVSAQCATTYGTDTQVACESFTWTNGITYYSSDNTAKDTLVNAAGCDSVVTLDLTINQPTTSTFTTTACDSFTWTNGITYYSSNTTDWDTLVNANGCDLYMHLNLTIVYSNSGTFTTTACDSYTWIDGNTYTESNNTATHTLTNAAGCDSVVTLDLTILSNESTFTTSACESFTWIDGVTYTASNATATHTLTNMYGCDSVVSLDLTILEPTAFTEVVHACNSYTWSNGITYTASNNTAKDTLVNAAGCDSIVSLDLTVDYTKTSTDVISACSPFVWTDGLTYTASNNTATNTYLSASGCDSIVSLDLTILSNESTDIISACDSYTWTDGVTYTVSNFTAKDTFVNMNGCDSVVTLNLTIQSNGSIYTAAACDSFVWVDGITYYANNNSATMTYTNIAGCDSVVTLDLTVNSSESSTDVISACDQYTWIDGNTYTESNNSASYTLTTTSGCDSIVSLDLTILPKSYGTDVITECGSYTWIDGIEYTASNNTATHTLTNMYGCDSVVSLDLTLLVESQSTASFEACDSFTWINDVTYYSSNNTATMMYTNAAGCDSIITLDLTINNTKTATDKIVACNSYTWTDGITYTSSNNTAIDTHQTVSGCDSIVSLDLTINYDKVGSDKILACESYTWIDGITYTSSNSSATHTLTTSKGCDSVVTLDLTVRQPSVTTDVITACDSYTWINGFTYTFSNNTSVYTIVTDAGCDSMVKLDLTIIRSDETVDERTACDSYTWIDGVTYTESTNAPIVTLTNRNGCDSTVTLNLTIVETTYGTDVVSNCDSYTWIDGVTYTESTNTPTYTLTNAKGCDSIVTLDLTISNSISVTNVITACNSYTWINGRTYTESTNTPVRRFIASNGCDSMVYLDLTINKPTSGVDVISACDRYTWIDGITYTSSTNEPTYTVENSVGCDSVVTLNLTVTTIDNSVTLQDPVITANEANATYQWLDCNNNFEPISGATDQAFEGERGSYAVRITKGDCVDTSECVTIARAGVHDNALFGGVVIYPNPTGNRVNINLAQLTNVNIVVMDLNGNVVYTKENIPGINHQFNLDEAAGVYILEIQAGEKRMRSKLIKN